ncbi:MAG: TadE family type IV pilus minor pilin [Pseudolysinimonas sp.]
MHSERGSVAAEFAVAMPAVLLLLATALGGVQLAGLQLKAQDAAADAARSYARGETAGLVAARLQRQVPGARVVRIGRGDLVCARVEVTPSGPIARLGLAAVGTSCALSGGR